jgi:uncharacterized protein YqjF (DUF2071 family)
MNAAPTLEHRLAQRERPNSRRAMYHTWRELLFLHWRYDPDEIQATLPRGLTVDTFDGAAWVGIVPFFMRNIRPVWLPTIPGLSDFQELNLRTYAYDRHGTPGVWFYSLDANCWPAVRGARLLYHLPYYWTRSRYELDRTTGHVRYESCRRGADPALACRFDYEPAGPQRPAGPGTLEFFLVERYILFAAGRDRLYSGQVHHAPYRIGDAHVRQWDANVIELSVLNRPEREPDHIATCRGVDVEVFPLKPVASM